MPASVIIGAHGLPVQSKDRSTVAPDEDLPPSGPTVSRSSQRTGRPWLPMRTMPGIETGFIFPVLLSSHGLGGCSCVAPSVSIVVQACIPGPPCFSVASLVSVPLFVLMSLDTCTSMGGFSAVAGTCLTGQALQHGFPCPLGLRRGPGVRGGHGGGGDGETLSLRGVREYVACRAMP